jgi:hypothetical protein
MPLRKVDGLSSPAGLLIQMTPFGNKAGDIGDVYTDQNALGKLIDGDGIIDILGGLVVYRIGL